MTRPTLKKADVGKRVTVEGYDDVKGTIRFVGKHAKDGTLRVGVELDTPVGKNNGTVKGHAYFECEAKHGVLSQPEKVKLVQEKKKSVKKGSPEKKSEESGAPKKKQSVKKKSEESGAPKKKQSVKKKSEESGAPTKKQSVKKKSEESGSPKKKESGSEESGSATPKKKSVKKAGEKKEIVKKKKDKARAPEVAVEEAATEVNVGLGAEVEEGVDGFGDDVSGFGDDVSGFGDDVSGFGDDVSGFGDDISTFSEHSAQQEPIKVPKKKGSVKKGTNKKSSGKADEEGAGKVSVKEKEKKKKSTKKGTNVSSKGAEEEGEDGKGKEKAEKKKKEMLKEKVKKKKEKAKKETGAETSKEVAEAVDEKPAKPTKKKKKGGGADAAAIDAVDAAAEGMQVPITSQPGAGMTVTMLPILGDPNLTGFAEPEPEEELLNANTKEKVTGEATAVKMRGVGAELNEEEKKAKEKRRANKDKALAEAKAKKAEERAEKKAKKAAAKAIQDAKDAKIAAQKAAAAKRKAEADGEEVDILEDLRDSDRVNVAQTADQVLEWESAENDLKFTEVDRLLTQVESGECNFQYWTAKDNDNLEKDRKNGKQGKYDMREKAKSTSRWLGEALTCSYFGHQPGHSDEEEKLEGFVKELLASRFAGLLEEVQQFEELKKVLSKRCKELGKHLEVAHSEQHLKLKLSDKRMAKAFTLHTFAQECKDRGEALTNCHIIPGLDRGFGVFDYARPEQMGEMIALQVIMLSARATNDNFQDAIKETIKPFADVTSKAEFSAAPPKTILNVYTGQILNSVQIHIDVLTCALQNYYDGTQQRFARPYNKGISEPNTTVAASATRVILNADSGKVRVT